MSTIAAEVRRDEGLWRIRQVADYLTLSERAVQALVAAGKLKVVRLGRRVAFRPADVRDLCARRTS